MKIGNKVRFTLKHKRTLCHSANHHANTFNREKLIMYGKKVGVVENISPGAISKRLMADVSWGVNETRSHYVDDLEVVE